MNKKRIGFNKLVEVIGKDFFECHKDTAVFSTEETDKGLFCFLGIDLHPEKARLCLSATMDEWDNDSRFQDLTLEELLYLKEHQELLAFID